MTDHAAARRHMLEAHVLPRGVRQPAVIEALQCVPRHVFIPEENRDLAYRDGPVAIGEGQTISQPYLVAMMSEALGITPGVRVLEIGTGSGYQAAILSALGARVTTVVFRPSLAESAIKTHHIAGAGDVDVRVGNGFTALDGQPPFPRIIVTAAPVDIPSILEDQLAEGGCMLIPAGPRTEQTLWRVERRNGSIQRTPLIPVRFVPMTGGPATTA